MARKKQEKKPGIDQKSLIELITKAMARNPRQPMNYKQIAARLKIEEKEEKKGSLGCAHPDEERGNDRGEKPRQIHSRSLSEDM